MNHRRVHYVRQNRAYQEALIQHAAPGLHDDRPQAIPIDPRVPCPPRQRLDPRQRARQEFERLFRASTGPRSGAAA